MKPSDDMLKAALAFVEQPDESPDVKAAFSGLGRAPLCALIDEMLSETPTIKIRGDLKMIAEMNQGCVEDLDRPDYCSYVVRKTGLSDDQIGACKRALRTFVTAQRMTRSNAGELIAARTDDGTTRRAVSSAEIAREIKRRK